MARRKTHSAGENPEAQPEIIEEANVVVPEKGDSQPPKVTFINAPEVGILLSRLAQLKQKIYEGRGYDHNQPVPAELKREIKSVEEALEKYKS